MLHVRDVTTTQQHVGSASIAVQSMMPPNRPHSNGHPFSEFRCDDTVESVIVDLVVVDRRQVAIVVGVEAVSRVVVHLLPPPVSLLVAVRVDPEVGVVNVRVNTFPTDIDIVQHVVAPLVNTGPADLARRFMGPVRDRPKVITAG